MAFEDKKELDEGEFVQEKNPKFIWTFLLIFLVISALFWGLGIWQNKITRDKRSHPFFDVTNRQFSLFLWQNPGFMKSSAEYLIGYLPHFHQNEPNDLFPDQADKYVSAPAEVIFRYHVWRRLLWDSLAPRPIKVKEFNEFLEQNMQWLPRFWPQAPKPYSQLVQRIQDTHSRKDLSELPLQVLPYEVRLAFQGWKNFVFEWNDILNVSPTRKELAEFLLKHKNYGYSYWRNILPGYLDSFKEGIDNGGKDSNDPVEDKELAVFLKIAYYNFVLKASGADSILN